MLLLLLSACIGDGDVNAALDGYCAVNEGRACTQTTQCCPGFVCAQTACRLLAVGTCLFPDPAERRQGKGEPCGCAADCTSSACTDSKCQ